MILQYEPDFDSKETAAVTAYMKKAEQGAWITEHTETERFEEELAKFVGVNYCSVVNNGTIAISLALLAVGIKPGDKVLVPALSMIATANAVTFIGAIPVFCDVDLYGLLDLDKAIETINLYKNTIKAVVFVSLNGRYYDTDSFEAQYFKKLLYQKNIAYIEDNAQALGSKYAKKGSRLGVLCDLATLSFSPHKIVSTGQGGAILTNSKLLHDKVEKLKDFGRLSGGSDIHGDYGINSKFTDLQAVIGLEQLKKINKRIEKKLFIYDYYRKNLKAGLIYERGENEVPWFVDFHVKQTFRDKVYKDLLLKKNIQTRKMYPTMPTQAPYLERNWNKSLASFLSETVLWLPCGFKLKLADLQYVCESINEIMEN